MIFKVLVLVYCLINGVTNYKILGVFHNPSKSHFHLGHTLLKTLAERKHEVTFITPYPVDTKLPNYEIIEVPGLQPSKDAIIKIMKTGANYTLFELAKNLKDQIYALNSLFLNHSNVQNVLNSNKTFDLVILDWIFNDEFLGIANHFKASSIVFNSFGSSSTTNKITFNPAPISYVPNIFPAASDDMDFSTRLLTIIIQCYFEFREFYREAGRNRYLHDFFPNAPDMKTLIKNVSLVLVNSHFTTETPRPYVPNMIQIGGFHIEEPKPLRGELKTFMDDARNGVLYCSFGSIVNSSDLNPETLKIFINTFSKIPLRVLWKYEGEEIAGLPKNIKVAKWFPQLAVLAHPNMKIFVSHSGMLSVSEALYCGVPILGVPFFGDQGSNLIHGISRGYAMKLTFDDLTEESFTRSIFEMLNNPKYKENAQQRSKWFRDQPMKPLDKAVYWVEYVLRHKGAHHLKIHAIKLNYIQYYLLDIGAFFGAIFILGIIITKLVLRISFRLFHLFTSKEKND